MTLGLLWTVAPTNAHFHVHNAITACLTQLSMNFNWFHATQVEESDNHALLFECKRRHFSIKNNTATRPRHKNSTGSTVLPLGLAQPKEQPRFLKQLSRFYLLPFPRKKLGYLTTWTPHVFYWQIQSCPFFCLTVWDSLALRVDAVYPELMPVLLHRAQINKYHHVVPSPVFVSHWSA